MSWQEDRKEYCEKHGIHYTVTITFSGDPSVVGNPQYPNAGNIIRMFGECHECAKQKKMAAEKEGCFIATAVYGSYDSPEVVVLRQFRDNTLLKTSFGNDIVKFYYTISPSVADLISKITIFSKVIKIIFLHPFVKFLKLRRIAKRT